MTVQQIREYNTDFNPRARVGRDAIVLDLVLELPISIHAPAWGATVVMAIVSALSTHFNPRARVGRDAAF